jgi:hypothetical protein
MNILLPLFLVLFVSSTCNALSQLQAFTKSFPNPFASFGGGGGKSVAILKADILTLAKSVDRGLSETSEQREEILSLFFELEKKMKIKAPLSSPVSCS